MYANTIAFAHALEPPSSDNMRRTLLATLAFATGAVVGWPFSLAVAIPFVFEELFVSGTDKVTSEAKSSWFVGRWKRMITSAATALLLLVRICPLELIMLM